MEAQVLQLVERSRQRGQGDEDSFVELKRELPKDHKKAARQIAAICNAARGNEVVWVVDIDERTGDIIGATETDLEAWWPQVEKHFDELPPEMSDIIVPSGPEGQVLLGLFFTTDRPPYVVKTGVATAEREVPWREGNRTRSARRNEILRMLLPATKMPRLEIREVELSCQYRARSATEEIATQNIFPRPANLWINMRASIFVEALNPVVFPQHEQYAYLHTVLLPRKSLAVRFLAKNGPNTWIEANNHAALVKNPTILTLAGDANFSDGSAESPSAHDGEFLEKLRLSLLEEEKVSVSISLSVAGGAIKWTESVSLLRDSRPHEYAPLIARWAFEK